MNRAPGGAAPGFGGPPIDPGALVNANAGRAEVILPFVTRLAESGTPLAEPRLAFDKMGDTYYLSEVGLPEKDGYLVRATKESHTHETVKGKKAK